MPRFWLAALALSCTIAAQAKAQPDAAPNEPLDLGFEAGELGKPPGNWRVSTDGWKAVLTNERAAVGEVSVRLSKVGDSTAPFGNLLRAISTKDCQGRHVTLSARIRVEGEHGRAQMWLRADRPNQQTGAFDNMGNRPIMPGDWTAATIEADVDADALQLAIGFMSFGGATLFIDDVSLRVTAPTPRQNPSPAHALSPRGLENLQAAARLLSYLRFFHPSDQAVAAHDWDSFAIHLMEDAEPATDPTDLAQRLSRAIAPLAPTLAVWPGAPDQATPAPPPPAGATALVHWVHHGVGILTEPRRNVRYTSEVEREALPSRSGLLTPPDCSLVKPLGAGVSCRLPVKVYADADGTIPHMNASTEWSGAPGAITLTGLNRSTRLAGVALCWGVMQHFFPYFDVVDTDWNAALAPALSKAATDADEVAYLATLQELIAKLHDGHGAVFNPGVMPTTRLPLALAWAGDDLVIVSHDPRAPAEMEIGDTVISIDSKPLAACCDDLSTRISYATEGWRRTVLLQQLVSYFPTADPFAMRLRHLNGMEYETTLHRIPMSGVEDVTANKPANAAEIAPRIVYFDLNAADNDALKNAMPALEQARGIIFDLRGYPGDAAYELMQHLIDHDATSAQWIIPVVTLPDHERWEWAGGGRWPLKPVEPRLTAKIAFLTDGRAISYAESIMGIVEAYKMGEIVGAATAGTNGNVNPFTLPGGYTVSWTGMKVLKHDGSQHHAVGIAPTIPIHPTAKGISEGRDEVLEKGIEVLQSQIAAANATAK